MGSYNSEYESYYNDIINKGKVKKCTNSKKAYDARSYDGKSYKGKGTEVSFIGNIFNKQRIYRRIIQEFTGVLFLLIILVFCKSNVLPQSKIVYGYSKQVVHQNLDLKKLESDFSKVRNLKLNDVEVKAGDFIKRIKLSLNAMFST